MQTKYKDDIKVKVDIQSPIYHYILLHYKFHCNVIIMQGCGFIVTFTLYHPYILFAYSKKLDPRNVINYIPANMNLVANKIHFVIACLC